MDLKLLVGILFMLLFLAIIVEYIFTALATYELAKNDEYDKSWLAWIPVLQNYLVIKYGRGMPWMIVLYVVNIILKDCIIENILSLIIIIYTAYMWIRICSRYKVEFISIMIGIIVPGVAAISMSKVYNIVKNKKYNRAT